MRPRAKMQAGLNKNDPDKRVYTVPAVDKAARILSLIRKEPQMTISEITAATGWHKSTVHKLVVTLNHHGLLDHDQKTRKYSLGALLAEYGRIAMKGLDIRSMARPFLQSLVAYTDETAALAILRGTKVVIVDLEEPQLQQVRVSLGIGMITPATATSNGKAMLAWLPEKSVDEIVQVEGLVSRTRNSITQNEIFRAELASIRERGYATDFEECLEGVSAISAPVRNSRGEPVGSLCLVIPSFRLTREKSESFGVKCAEMAAQLSAVQS